MVQEICEMRSNHWQRRIVQETPKPRQFAQRGNNGYRNQIHDQNRNYHRNGQRNVRRNGHRNGQQQWNKPRYNNSYRGGDDYRSNNGRKQPTYRGNQKYNGRNRSGRLNGKSVKFVRDVSLPDRSHYPQNENLTKTWELQNAQDQPWGSGVELVFFKGHEDIVVDKRYPVRNVCPGEKVQVSVELRTPILRDEHEEGRRCAYFRLEKNGKMFGRRVWVDIIVVIRG